MDNFNTQVSKMLTYIPTAFFKKMDDKFVILTDR